MQRRTLFAGAFSGILAGMLMPLLAACGDDRSGGTVRIQMPLPDDLDPSALQNDLDAQLAVNMYSGLVTLNAEGEPIPDIAQRWSISPDGRTYQFPLRSDVRFHNGEKLTAETPQGDVAAFARPTNRIAGGAPVSRQDNRRIPLPQRTDERNQRHPRHRYT